MSGRASAQESQLLATVQQLRCAEDVQQVRLLVDEVQRLPLSKAGLPAESGDVRLSSYLSAGSFELLLSAMLDQADRFPELQSEIFHTLSRWKYCPLVNIHGVSDVRVSPDGVVAVKAIYSSPDSWSGFSRLTEGLQKGGQSRHSEKSIYYSDSLQCLTDFVGRSKIKADRRLRGGPTRLRAGATEVAESWLSGLHECNANNEAHVVLSGADQRLVDRSADEVTFISKDATLNVIEKLLNRAGARNVSNLQQYAIDVHDVQISPGRDAGLPAIRSHVSAISEPATEPVIQPSPLIQSEADVHALGDNRLVTDQQPADDTVKTVSTGTDEPVYRSEHSPIAASVADHRTTAGVVEPLNSIVEPEVAFVEVFFTESRVLEMPDLRGSPGNSKPWNSKPGDSQLRDTKFRDIKLTEIPAVLKTEADPRVDLHVVAETESALYGGSALIRASNHTSKVLSRLSGTLQFSRKVDDGSLSIGADVTLKPISDSYWFARIGASANTQSDVAGYRWGIGYDDWHAGSWFLQLNNWGPVNAGSGLDLENAVLATGYKFKSSVLQHLNITSSASLNASAEGATDDRLRRFARNASASLTLQWEPVDNWFVRASFDQKLEGGPLRWSYVFGRYNWRANQLNFEYANYSQSRAFDPDFEKGTIGISYNLKF